MIFEIVVYGILYSRGLASLDELLKINLCFLKLIIVIITWYYLLCLQESREISLTQVPNFNKAIVLNCKEVTPSLCELVACFFLSFI